MNKFYDATPPGLLRLFWAEDPNSQIAILAVLGLAALALLFVYGPLCLRLFQLAKLQRAIAAAFGDDSPRKIQQREIAVAFERSPLAFQWREFLQRWRNACTADPEVGAVDESDALAPVRLSEVLDEHPALPLAVR